ncbi:MAG: thermonuclease family protein, partial [Planctomycetia bacterium]
APSAEPPPAGLAPQSAPPMAPLQSPTPQAAAPMAVAAPLAAGTAAALAASPPPQPIATQSAGSQSVPAQPVSLAPQQPAGRAGSQHLWRVVGVHDGDTLTCLDESNQQQKVRLAEIDAPEIGQDYGKVSREVLAEMVFGKTVDVTEEGKDRYGRWIGHLSLGGVDVNRQMIASGNAWHYVDYSRDTSLAALEAQARSQRLGLWAQPNPVAPWDFRTNVQK